MSKRKKSPQRRPVRSAQPDTAESHDKPISESRRRFFKLGLGVAGAVLAGVVAERAGLFDIFKGEEKNEQQVQSSIPEAPGLSEYDEWSSKIELPKIESSENKIDLAKYLVPSATKEQLNIFREKLLTAEKDMKAKLDNTSDPEERMGILNTFINTLFADSVFAVKYPKTGLVSIGSKESYAQIRHLNKLLIAVGSVLSIEYKPDTKNYSVALSEIKKQSAVTTGTGPDTPIVYVDNQRDFYTRNKDDVIELQGKYEPESGVIIIDQHSAMMRFYELLNAHKTRVARTGNIPHSFDNSHAEEFQKSYELHEAMHSEFGKMLDNKGIGNDTTKRGVVNKKNGVKMDGYTLPSEFFANISVGELHEIVAGGYGLMRSGKSASIVAHAILTTGKVEQSGNKEPSSDVIVNEILSLAQKKGKSGVKIGHRKGDSVNLDLDELVYLIYNYSDEDLHRIGERIAKLGIYLAQ